MSKKYPLNTNELKAIFEKEDGESNDITEPSGDIGNSYAAIDSSGVESGEHGHYATPLSQVNKHNIDEVFHVAGELVDYDTADQVCKQYGREDWHHTMSCFMHISMVLNGVIMVGVKIKRHIIQLKRKLGKDYNMVKLNLKKLCVVFPV